MTIISAANRVSFLSRRHKILERMFGDFLFCGFAWDDKHRPLRRCRRAALHIYKMSAVQIHLSRSQKHFLQNFSRVIPSKSACFCRRYSCTPLAICTGCAIMWIVTPAACAGGCKRRAPCKACPTIIIRKRSFT